MVTNEATQQYVIRVPKVECEARTEALLMPDLPYFCPYPYCLKLFREAHSLMFHFHHVHDLNLARRAIGS